jgi:hypothetical protein
MIGGHTIGEGVRPAGLFATLLPIEQAASRLVWRVKEAVFYDRFGDVKVDDPGSTIATDSPDRF